MKNGIRTFGAVAALAAGFGAAGTANAQIVIDDFTTGFATSTGVVDTMFLGGTGGDPALADVLGGSRVVTFDVVSNLFNESLSIAAGPDAAGLNADVLSIATPAGAAAETSLFYDADGAGLGVDLTGIDAASVLIDFIAVDAGFADDDTIDVTVTLSDGTNTISATQDVAEEFDPAGFTEGFLLASFDGADTFDFTSVFSVEVAFNSPTSENGVDVIVDTIEFDVIPTPGVLSLAGLGVLVATRRRR